MDIAIANVNIEQVRADLLVLKHANGFYGADRAVARAVGFAENVPLGNVRFHPGAGVAARDVAFVGVGPLQDFRYERIQEFGAQAVRLAQRYHRVVQHLALTMHGPGYGLDAEESFLSMLAGLIAEWKEADGALQRITIAELSEKRCELMDKILAEHLAEFGLSPSAQRSTVSIGRLASPKNASIAAPANIVHFGARSEEKPRLFIAMPFAEEFTDEFEIAFREAAKASEYICERLDLETFTGDIVSEIKKRILVSHGVIALLNNHNPNVFLEVGFAWAHNKPTILVAKNGTKLPFDVSGQRCIIYRNISHLRQVLNVEIASLKAQGTFAKSA